MIKSPDMSLILKRNCAGRSATDQKARDVSTMELLSKEQFQLIYKVVQVAN
ncbi:hypothetical protein ACS0TY_018591 [Phlomoides rotata]